ncbi:MAG: molybdopterin-dependent oxidoreductase [Bacteroidota bacterium]
MAKTLTRRDILKFTGGGILGLMFSPLPWKLLDDSSIWTQNWGLTPKLAHGPIAEQFSHCTLCAGGCGIKARTVSGMPYSITGISGHPISYGTVCARGLAGHHMAYHPLRIVHPHMFTGKGSDSAMTAVSLQSALDATAQHIRETRGSIAILDQQPGRAISEIYKEFLSTLPNGIFLSSPSNEDATLLAIQAMVHQQKSSYGFDFENADLILSFGAPLFDYWGTPGRMSALRNAGTPKIIQVDSRYSRTAMQSDEWIAIQPGTEKYLALGVAHLFLTEKLIPVRNLRSAADFAAYGKTVNEFIPEKVSLLTGIDSGRVREIARTLASSQRPIVVSGADPGGGPFDGETEKAIAALNILLGNVGTSGGIVSRFDIPGYKNSSDPIRWSSIPDHSIGVLIVDGADSGYALPWSLVQRKLIPNEGFIVSLAPVLNEISAHADYLIPSPGHLETLQDIPTPTGFPAGTFALSTPLLKKQEGTTDSVDVIRELSVRLNKQLEIPTQEALLKQKSAALFSQKRGSLHIPSDNSILPIRDLSSADDLWTKLTEGAVWIDELLKQTSVKSFTIGLAAVEVPNPKQGTNELPMIAYGWRGATSTAQISPIMSKVFQETELRAVNGTVSVNPTTALQYGLSKEEPADLSTINGTMKVRVKVDPTVRPGVIEASIAPLPNGIETPKHPAGNNILNLCEVTNDGTWRMTTAKFLKV